MLNKNKIIGAALGLGMALATVAPTFAAQTIRNTGFDSFNKIRIRHNVTTNVTNTQVGYVKNAISNKADTGDNELNENTRVNGGGIDTGNATSNVTVNNTLNQSLTQITGCGCPEEESDQTIQNTGAKSDNIIKINNSNTTTVNNVQVGGVKNYIYSKADTGDNEMNRNTNVQGGGIQTGDANSTVVVDNFVNNSVTIIGP